MAPPKGPVLARSGSTWIHWWSPVASANRLTRSWVIVCHSEWPSCLPASSWKASTPSTVVVMGALLAVVGGPCQPCRDATNAEAAHYAGRGDPCPRARAGDPVHHHRDSAAVAPGRLSSASATGWSPTSRWCSAWPGANPGGSIVRLAGVAGLVAGSFSMAAGEYLSMTAQRELHGARARGGAPRPEPQPRGGGGGAPQHVRATGASTPPWPTRWSHEVMQDPDLALETHAREELGIETAELGIPLAGGGRLLRHLRLGRLRPAGRPGSSTSGTAGASCCRSCSVPAAALVVGVVLARFTDAPGWPPRLRQLAVTAVAAAVTYGVGRGAGVGTRPDDASDEAATDRLSRRRPPHRRRPGR